MAKTALKVSVNFRGLNMMHTVVVALQMNIAIFPSGLKADSKEDQL